MTFCNHEFTNLQLPPSDSGRNQHYHALTTTTCKTRAVGTTGRKYEGLRAGNPFTLGGSDVGARARRLEESRVALLLAAALRGAACLEQRAAHVDRNRRFRLRRAGFLELLDRADIGVRQLR